MIFNICIEIHIEWWRSSESKNNADITTFPRLQIQYYLKTSGILSIFPSIFREYFAICLVNVIILTQSTCHPMGCDKIIVIESSSTSMRGRGADEELKNVK